MTEEIGTGSIKLTGDATGFTASIAEAKKAAQSLGTELGNSTQAGAAKAKASVEAYLAKLQQTAQNAGKTASEIKLLDLAQRGATESQLAQAAAAFKTIEAAKQQAAEARRTAAATAAAAAAEAARARSSAALAGQTKLTAFQTTQLGYQLQDFFVQVQAGQSPLTALIQQGSQLSGTFGGLGGAVRAVLTIFTAARVVFGGITATIGAFAVAAYQGSEESRKLQNTLLLTANAAGITEGRFNAAAQSIAASTNTTIGSTREVLQTLIATGRFTGDALTSATTAAQSYAAATGRSTEDVLKQFVSMADGVTDGAETLNKQFNFLTAAQLRQIRTAEEQGDSNRALALTFDALNERMSSVTNNLGLIDRASRGASNTLSAVWDWMKSIGRDTTAEEKLAALTKRLEDLQALRTRTLMGSQDALGSQAEPKVLTDLRDQQAYAQEMLRLQQRGAAVQAANAARNRAQIVWDKAKEATLTKQERLAKELAKTNAEADAAGVSAADREQQLARIREKYEDKGGANKANELRKAKLDADLELIKSGLKGEVDAYTGAESILEATRSAGLVGITEYYQAKLAFLELDADAQVRALTAENARIAKEKATSTDRVRDEKEIAKNEAEIARIRADATTKGVVLSIQSAAAKAAETRALIDARIAAQQYLDTLTLQGQRELENIRLSDRARERAAGRQQIDDRYTQQRQELQATRTALELEGKFTEEARTQYNARLAIVDEFNTKALQSFERTFDQRVALEANASIGAQRAWENYRDNAANVMRQTEDLYSRTFQSLEDTLVTFVTTGKLSFKSLADSITTEIVRIQIRAAASKIFGGSGVTDFLGNLASSLFGGSTGAGSMGTDYSLPTSGVKFGGPKAGGGSVERGRLYQVNELGPELLNLAGKQYLMMGSQSGSVTPHDQSMQQLRGGMSQAMAAQVVKVSLPAINVINNTGTAATATAQQRSDGGIDVILEALQNQVADGIASGAGPVGKAIEGRYGLRPSFST